MITANNDGGTTTYNTKFNEVKHLNGLIDPTKLLILEDECGKISKEDFENAKIDENEVNKLMEKHNIIYGTKGDLETDKPHNAQHKGLRFNKGKLRYDLFHPFADQELARVFTRGAEKYLARNWEKGMSWTSVIASLKRHLAALERGEDYDEETGLMHSAQVAWNSHVLTAYYKIYPQGDDRNHSYLNMPKIGLDIDEVICDWVNPWCSKYGHTTPDSWYFSYKNRERLDTCTEELQEFYRNLPPKISPKDIPFEPHAYITSRSLPIALTMDWIERNGFPTKPVYCVGFGESKVEVAKQSGIDVFVDDNFSNFVELNKAGICTYLLDAPHNQRYEVGYKRIKSLKELYERFK